MYANKTKYNRAVTLAGGPGAPEEKIREEYLKIGGLIMGEEVKEDVVPEDSVRVEVTKTPEVEPVEIKEEVVDVKKTKKK